MAIYKVNTDGNAPSYAKAGDYISTGAGTYQILDSKIYSGMSKEQLAKAGVGYNPINNLYSKKVTDSTSPFYTGVNTDGNNYKTLVNRHTDLDSWDPLTYDRAQDWKDAYINSQIAQMQQNYNSSLSDLKKSYNKNMAAGEKQMRQVDADYSKNLRNLYDDTYAQRKQMMANSGRNGVTSTAQAKASSDYLFFKATDQASDLASDRDTLKDNIRSELNRLSEDYNINKDTLKQNFNVSKLNAMSTAELQYLEQILKIDEYNNGLWNQLTTNKLSNDFTAAEAEKNRQFQAAEAQKDRNLQMQMLARQLAASSRGYGGSGSSETPDNGIDRIKYYLNYETNGLTDTQRSMLAAKLAGVEAGVYSEDEWMKEYNKLMNPSSTSSNSDSGSGLKGFLEKFGNKNIVNSPSTSTYQHDWKDYFRKFDDFNMQEFLENSANSNIRRNQRK